MKTTNKFLKMTISKINRTTNRNDLDNIKSTVLSLTDETGKNGWTNEEVSDLLLAISLRKYRAIANITYMKAS